MENLNNSNEMKEKNKIINEIKLKIINKSVKEIVAGNFDLPNDCQIVIDDLESHNLDFKENFPKQGHDIAKIISAFANHEGGDIFFGIKDRPRLVIGVEYPQIIEERISGLMNKFDPRPEYNYKVIRLKENLSVLQVHIEKSTILVQYDGRFYFREKNSSKTIFLKSDEIKERIMDYEIKSEKEFRLADFGNEDSSTKWIVETLGVINIIINLIAPLNLLKISADFLFILKLFPIFIVFTSFLIVVMNYKIEYHLSVSIIGFLISIISTVFFLKHHLMI